MIKFEHTKVMNLEAAKVVELFNSICKSYPTVKTMSDKRRKAIKARLQQYSLEDIESVFRKAENSAFLKGEKDGNWKATFDWLIADSNFAKVFEGNFDDTPKKRKETVSGEEAFATSWAIIEQELREREC